MTITKHRQLLTPKPRPTGWFLKITHHLTSLKLIRHRHQLRHILAKIEVLQGFGDVLARDGFLGVFLGDVVGFGGDHGDELDAALDQEVAGFFGEGHGLRVFRGGFGGENFVDDLLDRCWGVVLGFWFEGGLRVAEAYLRIPLGRERSSLPMFFYVSVFWPRWFALQGRQEVIARYSPPISLSDMLK